MWVGAGLLSQLLLCRFYEAALRLVTPANNLDVHKVYGVRPQSRRGEDQILQLEEIKDLRRQSILPF